MRVAVLQSNYIPWKGYFDIIRSVDLFIFYDDVQYTKHNWRNRNLLKTENGLKWITIPCGESESRLICEVKLCDNGWQEKHWRMIEENYRKAPYWDRYSEMFRSGYMDKKWTNLSELNQYLIIMISREILGIKTQFGDSRDYSLQDSKAARLLQLIKKTGADEYLSGPSAKNYIDEAEFERAGVKVLWMNYDWYFEYPQLYEPFEHGVSIIDLIFNTGPEAPRYIWGMREDMAA